MSHECQHSFPFQSSGPWTVTISLLPVILFLPVEDGMLGDPVPNCDVLDLVAGVQVFKSVLSDLVHTSESAPN